MSTVLNDIHEYNALVSITLEGYSSFSLSLSVRVFSAATPLDEAEARADSNEGLLSEEDGLPAIGGVSDWARGRGMPPFWGDIGGLEGLLTGTCPFKMLSSCAIDNERSTLSTSETTSAV